MAAFSYFFACRIREQPVTKGWVKMVELNRGRKKKKKPFRWLNDWVCQWTWYSTGLHLRLVFGLLVGLFRSWFKSDYSVTRKGKPKIGLQHHNNVDMELRLLKDNVASSHIINEPLFSLFFLFFFCCLNFQFGYQQSETKPLRAQVLAVVFSHSILSGILALEANMLI